MPKPVYIICSQAGIEDKRTGLVSIFNVIEKIQITTKQLDPTSKQSILGIHSPCISRLDDDRGGQTGRNI
jgi:hypothetical protein